MATKQLGMDRKMLEMIAGDLADELARSMYHKLVLLKAIPEIEAVKKVRLR